MSHYESERVQEMQLELLNLNKERNFYYKKLTDIEVLVQSTLDDPVANGTKAVALASRIKDVLYALEVSGIFQYFKKFQ